MNLSNEMKAKQAQFISMSGQEQREKICGDTETINETIERVKAQKKMKPKSEIKEWTIGFFDMFGNETIPNEKFTGTERQAKLKVTSRLCGADGGSIGWTGMYGCYYPHFTKEGVNGLWEEVEY